MMLDDPQGEVERDLDYDDDDDTCQACGGEGYDPDCGEDTCCCLEPWDDHPDCPECGGSGHA